MTLAAKMRAMANFDDDTLKLWVLTVAKMEAEYDESIVIDKVSSHCRY